MLHKIEQLRKKPKHVRDRYAVSGALLVTALVAVIWVASLPSRFNEVPDAMVNGDTQGGFVRAMSDVQDQFATAIGSLGEAFDSLKEAPPTVDLEEIKNDPATVPKPDYELDIAAMFATTSQAIEKESTTTTKQLKQILIATSSAAVESN